MERIGEIREAFTRVAESAWLEAEVRVREAEGAVADNGRRIHTAMTETALAAQFSAETLQNRERYIARLRVEAADLQAAADEARKAAEVCHDAWREARREEKVLDKVCARRETAWLKETAVAEQKNADDLTTARFVRNRIHSR